jgi:hypothetical protein
VTVTKTTFHSVKYIQARIARPLKDKGKRIKVMNEREADETAKYGYSGENEGGKNST